MGSSVMGLQPGGREDSESVCVRKAERNSENAERQWMGRERESERAERDSERERVKMQRVKG